MIMTEDDTFRKLMQTPFLNFRKLVIQEYRSSGSALYHVIPEEFYQKHGWTKKEYEIEAFRVLKERFHRKDLNNEYNE